VLVLLVLLALVDVLLVLLLALVDVLLVLLLLALVDVLLVLLLALAPVPSTSMSPKMLTHPENTTSAPTRTQALRLIIRTSLARRRTRAPRPATRSPLGPSAPSPSRRSPSRR